MMKACQKRQIIFGYRYDPQSSTVQRLHQLKIVQGNEKDKKYVTNSTDQKDYEHQLNRTLKTENLLLRAQIKRLRQNSSYKSYEVLVQAYYALQNQRKELTQLIAQLRMQRQVLQQQYKVMQTFKCTTSKSQSQIFVNQGQKYTFSPYHNSQDSSCAQQNPPVGNLQKNIHPYKNKLQDQQQTHKYGKLKLLDQYQSVISYSQKLVNSPPYPYFQGIDSNYLYNNVRVIQSQISQQLQSQVLLDKNFSFMPRPLVKNVETLKFLPQDQKGISSRKQHKILNSDQNFNRNRGQPFLSNQSIQIQQQHIVRRDILTGLKKLPSKPISFETEIKSQMSVRQTN